MPLTKNGLGTLDFVVASVVLVPSHAETPPFSPDNPNPAPVIIPDKVTGTLSPVKDAASEVVVTGNIVITTELISAFAVGDKYTLTFAAAGAPV